MLWRSRFVHGEQILCHRLPCLVTEHYEHYYFITDITAVLRTGDVALTALLLCPEITTFILESYPPLFCLFVLFSYLSIFLFYRNISLFLSTCSCSTSSSCFHVSEGGRELLLSSCSQNRNTSLREHISWSNTPHREHISRRTHPLDNTPLRATHSTEHRIPFSPLPLQFPSDCCCAGRLCRAV